MSAPWVTPLSLREPKYAQGWESSINLYQPETSRNIQKAVSQAREFSSVFHGAAVMEYHQLGGWEIVNLSLKSLLEKKD